MKLLRLLGILFLLVGASLWQLAGHDPAPPESWQAYHGSVQEVQWYDGHKTGIGCKLRLVGTEEFFSRDQLQSDQALLQSLRSKLQAGLGVNLLAVPRAQAYGHPANMPMPILELTSGNEVLLARQPTDDWIGVVVRGVSVLIAGLGVALLALAQWLRRTTAAAGVDLHSSQRG